jgi:hypothetical protein
MHYRHQAAIRRIRQRNSANVDTWLTAAIYKEAPTDLWHHSYLPSRQTSESVSMYTDFFHSRTVHLDINRVFYLPTDAQENCFKKDIKIYIKTAPTCFGLITIIRERII